MAVIKIFTIEGVHQVKPSEFIQDDSFESTSFEPDDTVTE